MSPAPPVVAVLGAAGLLGQAIAEFLDDRGFPTYAIARRFTAAQRARFGDRAVTATVVSMAADDLARILADKRITVVVNCLGVLQDTARDKTADVHEGFVRRLLAAMGPPGARLLIQISIPGAEEDDRTSFSRTKREGERLIAASGHLNVILRPGFVIAPAAYGGSALLRALAAVPLRLPDVVAATPFAAVSVADISRTVAIVARQWADGARTLSATWELVAREPTTVGDAVDAFRRRLGGPAPLLPLPLPLLQVGAVVGDLVARLGWTPPVRTTALAEMRRGVTGDPGPWMAATGIVPLSLAEAVAATPSTVQERWFAKLFLLKPVVVGGLSLFWIASGAIALFVSFVAAAGIFTAHGYPPWLANALTVFSSLMDMSVGFAIAVRRTHRAGLLAGVALSLSYMGSAALLTPELWIEPLGALVKTGPAIILMLVALAIADDR